MHTNVLDFKRDTSLIGFPVAWWKGGVGWVIALLFCMAVKAGDGCYFLMEYISF